MVLPGAIPYPPEIETGYWGIPTSTIDWCEENYVVSPYIAEFINTVTNAAFILLGLYALYIAVRHKMEHRFVLAALGYILVGAGSWLFHMTLQYHYQLLDELPMIYGTCVPCWSVFQTKRSKKESSTIAGVIAFSALLLTAIYLWFRDPTIHQTAYGLLNVVVVYKSVRDTQNHVDDPEARKILFQMVRWGLSEFVLGYVLWNVDIHFCSFWRPLRRAIGIPYGFIFEGHGWWHLLTGIGVYTYLVYLEYQRSFILGNTHKYTFKWKFWIFPVFKLKNKSD